MKNALLFLLITACVPRNLNREACYALARHHYDTSADNCSSVETCDWDVLGARFQREQEACR